MDLEKDILPPFLPMCARAHMSVSCEVRSTTSLAMVTGWGKMPREPIYCPAGPGGMNWCDIDRLDLTSGESKMCPGEERTSDVGAVSGEPIREDLNALSSQLVANLIANRMQ